MNLISKDLFLSLLTFLPNTVQIFVGLLVCKTFSNPCLFVKMKPLRGSTIFIFTIFVSALGRSGRVKMGGQWPALLSAGPGWRWFAFFIFTYFSSPPFSQALRDGSI